MSELSLFAISAINNNAVRATDGSHEFVLVGRGIGFNIKAGDAIAFDESHKRYQLLDSVVKARYMDLLGRMDPKLLDAVSRAIDFAGDIIEGTLHPSLYVVLTDHLAFAIERVREGIQITNPLVQEIRAVFGDEYAAAEVMMNYLNSVLDVRLPADECAFVALHLNAARRGSSVKEPLRYTNEIAKIVAVVESVLGTAIPPGVIFDRLVARIAEDFSRLAGPRRRQCSVSYVASRELPAAWELAGRMQSRMTRHLGVADAGAGEQTYLAVWLDGWLYELDAVDTDVVHEELRDGLADHEGAERMSASQAIRRLSADDVNE
ncbi:PRD domain-containing protein [Arcanobacterium haemolyticum]|nr:PRD domain-containing protein [Arcanobacterium haemolyticum]